MIYALMKDGENTVLCLYHEDTFRVDLYIVELDKDKDPPILYQRHVGSFQYPKQCDYTFLDIIGELYIKSNSLLAIRFVDEEEENNEKS